MRKVYAGAVFGMTVVVVLGIIVLTWRPWQAGANDRITASGLVPVLTLLLGQLGSWVVASGSNSQATAVREAELKHEADQADKAAERSTAERAKELERAQAVEQRELIAETLRATAALGPALSLSIQGYNGGLIPTKEFARARVAVLSVARLNVLDETLATAAATLIESMNNALESREDDIYADRAPSVLKDLTRFEQMLSGRVVSF